jgi:spore germination protein YaaH
MPKLKFNAWLVHWNEASFRSFQAHAALLGRVYPVWIGMGEGGLPQRNPHATLARRRAVRETAAAAGVELWPLISNYSEAKQAWDGGLMRLVMGDRGTRRGHILRLLELVREDGGTGVDLDYEALFDEDRALLSDFVEELAAAFHAQGLKVGIAVHAKEAEPGTPGGSRAQDYVRLGAVCDRVQIMGYDFHWAGGEPGPVAPPDWVGRVLDHALACVPREKIELGVPGYGNDWGPAPARQTRGLDWEAWTALVRTYGPARRDAASAELTLRFAGREAWMNDAHALAAKLWQARERGVGEAAMWVLGSEDPRVWALIETLPEDFVR